MFYCDFSKFTNINNNGIPKQIVLPSHLHIENYINKTFGLDKDSYYLILNGKIVDINGEELNIDGDILYIIPRLPGGKGGFGSMLRAIGAQIEKTTNREACRDLSGRRLRDINEEQRLKNWISQQADREREAVERKKKKLERLCQEPKHEFNDDKYDESRSLMPEKMSTSIEQGLKASSSGPSTVNLKRKQSADKSISKSCKKKKNLWIDAEDSDSSSNNDSENEKAVSK